MECDHKERNARNDGNRNGVDGFSGSANKDGHADMGAKLYKDTCPKCGARRVDAQIGLEPTPEAYVTNIVAVMRECWRVMREDAVLWLNLGDSYCNSNGYARANAQWQRDGRNDAPANDRNLDALHNAGYKTKDLLGIPWRVAFALQQDGWYLRSDIIWHKPNPMPESVTDRPTKSHEYVFLLAKQERYYYDAEAIRENFADKRMGNPGTNGTRQYAPGDRQDIGRPMAWTKGAELGGRNRRSVWTIATQPYSGSHFAVFPQALVEPMILAGTSPQACEHCGAAWERVIESPKPPIDVFTNTKKPQDGFVSVNVTGKGMGQKYQDWRSENPTATTGWRPTCQCPDNTGSGRCIVLDPFSGSGTVGRVCAKLGRSFVGGELNPAYIELAQHRTSGVQIAALL